MSFQHDTPKHLLSYCWRHSHCRSSRLIFWFAGCCGWGGIPCSSGPRPLVFCLGFWVVWQWKYKAQSSTSPDKIIIIHRQHCSLLCLRSHILLSHWCHILPCLVQWGREEKGCFSYPEKSKGSFNYITIRKAFLPSPSSRMQKISPTAASSSEDEAMPLWSWGHRKLGACAGWQVMLWGYVSLPWCQEQPSPGHRGRQLAVAEMDPSLPVSSCLRCFYYDLSGHISLHPITLCPTVHSSHVSALLFQSAAWLAFVSSNTPMLHMELCTFCSCAGGHQSQEAPR